MNNLVSIIIPVYNVEQYIEECLNSVLEQTYSNLEIVLIDDGSTDSSGKICDIFSKKDHRIKTIHKENEGVSSARNIGLDMVTGDYVLFADSDDILEKNYVEKMIGNFEENDMTICGYYEYYSDKNIEHFITDNALNISKNDTYNYIFDFNGCRGFLWNKAFKRSIIKKNRLKFNTDIHMCEDQLFVVNYLLYCTKILIIPDCLYYYRIRNNSIVSGINKQKLYTMFDAYYQIKKVFKNNNIVCLDFKYEVLWHYYTYKSYINRKYFYLLDIKKYKKDVFSSKYFSIIKKLKLFVKIYLNILYIIKEKNKKY